jgi:predicted kinase
MTFESNAVIVVAGMPGAGKTTLIRRAVDRDAATVLDTDDLRAGRASPPRLLNLRHYLRIVAAMRTPRPLVIHTRGSRAPLRRLIATLARLHGRPAHLLLLDADRSAAEAGQRARGRTLAARKMDREAAGWRTLIDGPERLAGEGWASTVLLARPEAARIAALEFGPTAREFGRLTPGPSPARARPARPGSRRGAPRARRRAAAGPSRPAATMPGRRAA